jgi:hypothetical protein
MCTASWDWTPPSPLIPWAFGGTAFRGVVSLGCVLKWTAGEASTYGCGAEPMETLEGAQGEDRKEGHPARARGCEENPEETEELASSINWLTWFGGNWFTDGRHFGWRNQVLRAWVRGARPECLAYLGRRRCFFPAVWTGSDDGRGRGRGRMAAACGSSAAGGDARMQWMTDWGARRWAWMTAWDGLGSRLGGCGCGMRRRGWLRQRERVAVAGGIRASPRALYPAVVSKKVIGLAAGRKLILQ